MLWWRFVIKGYECEKCGTELHYEQIDNDFLKGVRLKRQRDDGTYYYSVYCPKCKEYFEVEK